MSNVTGFVKKNWIWILLIVGIPLHILDQSNRLANSLAPYFILILFLRLLYELIMSKEYKLITALIIVISLGFILEAVGTNSGLIFGEYIYTDVLGLSIFNTPLIIGLLWFILVGGALAFYTKAVPKYSAILFSAMTVTLFDVLIEPVAIAFDYWQWEGNEVPLQNYLAWFFIALLFSTILYIPIKNGSKEYLHHSREVFKVVLVHFLIINISLLLGVK